MGAALKQDPGFFHFSGKWVRARRGRRVCRGVLNYMHKATESSLRSRAPVTDITSYMRRKDDLKQAQADVLHAVFRDRGSGLSSEDFWNANDLANRRRDGAYKNHAGKMPRLGVFIVASYPYGVTLDDAKVALDQFLDFLGGHFGVAAEAVIHAKRDGEPDHAHILMTDRHVDTNGVGDKVRDLNGVAAKIEGRGEVDGGAVLAPAMEAMRSQWAATMREIAPEGARRIDPRSFQRQGISIAPVTPFSQSEIRRQQKGGRETWKVEREAELAARANAFEREKPKEGKEGDLVDVETSLTASAPAPAPALLSVVDAPPVGNEIRGAQKIDAATVIAHMKAAPPPRSSPSAIPLALVGILAAHARSQSLKPTAHTDTDSTPGDHPVKDMRERTGRVPFRRTFGHRGLAADRSSFAIGRRRFNHLRAAGHGQSSLLEADTACRRPASPSASSIALSTLFELMAMWIRQTRRRRAKALRLQELARLFTPAHRTQWRRGVTAPPGWLPMMIAALRWVDLKAAKLIRDEQPRKPAFKVLSEGAVEEKLNARSAPSASEASIATVVLNSSARPVELLQEHNALEVRGPIDEPKKTLGAQDGRRQVEDLLHARQSEPRLDHQSIVDGLSNEARNWDRPLGHTFAGELEVRRSAYAGRPAIEAAKEPTPAYEPSSKTEKPEYGRTKDTDPVDSRPEKHSKPLGGEAAARGSIVNEVKPNGDVGEERPPKTNHAGKKQKNLPALVAVKYAAALYQERKWSLDFEQRLQVKVGFEGDFDTRMKQEHQRLFRENSLSPREVKNVVKEQAQANEFTDLIAIFDEIENEIRGSRRKRKSRNLEARLSVGRVDNKPLGKR